MQDALSEPTKWRFVGFRASTVWSLGQGRKAELTGSLGQSNPCAFADGSGISVGLDDCTFVGAARRDAQLPALEPGGRLSVDEALAV